MRHYQIVEGQGEPSGSFGGEIVDCPRCRTGFVFCRSRRPFIDACGFENYAMQCHQCGAELTGVVDPADETLLLTAKAA